MRKIKIVIDRIQLPNYIHYAQENLNKIQIMIKNFKKAKSLKVLLNEVKV